MQAKRFVIRQQVRRYLALLTFSLVVLGCGGGTTGTSPSDTFKLVGGTENAQQNALPRTEMSVVSGTSDQILVESETDTNGAFAMELPAGEDSLIVDIQGVRSSPLERELLGPSIVSTILRQDQTGSLSFPQTFEAQIDTSNLCEALTSDGNTLYILSDRQGEFAESCTVRLRVRSKGSTDLILKATLQSSCTDARQPVLANPDDTISIDLSPIINSGCEEAEIVVSSDEQSLSDAVFPIIKVP